MTDWSRLTHAYGTAENIPELLDQLATAPTSELWDDLWSALCHQGDVYPASFAALPRLAELASSPDPKQAFMAVVLASAIVAGGKDTVRADHAEPVVRLLDITNRLLPDAPEANYPYLLECVFAFEGVAYWADDLAWIIAGEESDVSCPACEAGVVVYDGEYTDENGESRPIRPADPARLQGIGRTLYQTAVGHGRDRIAWELLLAFGQAPCPSCGVEFAFADQVLHPAR